MATDASWVEVLNQVLTDLGRRIGDSESPESTYKRLDFRRVSGETEAEMSRRGIALSNPEWQATKQIMKTIYDKTRSAHKYGYDFYQYALTPHLEDARVRTSLQSPVIQRAVDTWCGSLGWKRASIVKWTSVMEALAEATPARFPYSANEFAVRLEGLGKRAIIGNRELIRPEPLSMPQRFPR